MEKFGIIIEIAGGQIYGLLSKFFGFNVSLKKRGGEGEDAFLLLLNFFVDSS